MGRWKTAITRTDGNASKYANNKCAGTGRLYRVSSEKVWRLRERMASCSTEHSLKSMRVRFVQLALPLGDASALLSAMAVAFVLRFDGMSWGGVYADHIRKQLPTIPVAIAIYLAVFSAFRLYRYAWRFVGLEIVWGVLSANTIGLTALVTLQLLAEGRTFPRSVLVILWILSVLFVGGSRILLRLASASHQNRNRPKPATGDASQAKGVIILGGGIPGARILRAIREDLGPAHKVIGLLDDDPQSRGTYIGNMRVLGPLRMLYDLLGEEAIGEVIVALPDVGGREIREYVLECRKRGVPVKVIPRMDDVLSGRTYLRLEEFSVEDLLRRPPVRIDMADVGGHLADRRVLVTGAGGSIGSEICRQVMAFGPASLVLFGHGENSVFQARQQILRDYRGQSDRVHWVIGSVAHQTRLRQVFSEFRPEVVFHAAAHKHVPIMEANIQEAVFNNVFGTRHVVEACGRNDVRRMVFISTDKAADPESIMGATKYLCEEIMRSSASLWPETAFVSVRFGNVLGSRGSVVPLFREQIRHGGPVTVTHPEMTRYFMTIPEAVQLVLQAGVIGASGQVYLLDMGDPVKILDLAKDMIRLSGFEPDVDIPIAFTGVRPGERLHERLIAVGERIENTSREGLSLVHRPERFTSPELLDILRRMQELADMGPASELRELLHSVTNGHTPPTNNAEAVFSPQTYGAATQS